MKKYAKLPLSIPDQIQRLKNRNLIIMDDDYATRHIANIGYYRLSAYFLPYKSSLSDAENQPSYLFKSDTSFTHIVDLYIFDRKLRLLVMEAIERIEVAVRAQWVNALSLSTQNAHAYLDRSNFNDSVSHGESIEKIQRDIMHSKELFIEHYLNNYDEPLLPPVWASVETMTLGSLSRWYSNTKDNEVKKRVAKELGMPTVSIMETVLHIITLIRNICAHHARLWNRKMIMRLPKINSLKNEILTEEDGSHARREIYNYLIVLVAMIKSINPTTSWAARVAELISNATPDQQVAMGFPLEWENRLIWQ